MAVAERAVEAGIVDVGTNAQNRHAPEGQAVHLIQGSFRISAAGAAAERGADPYLAHNFYACAGTEALEQVLVEKACAHQRCIERGNFPEVVIVRVEFNPLNRVHAESEEVASQAGARRRSYGIAPGVVELRRLVDGESPFVG